MASTINASTTLGLQQTADTSGVLQLQTANTTAVTINASQNVGIGTSSPAVKLDVNGAVSVASGYNITWGGAYAANIPTMYGVSGASAYIAWNVKGSSGESMRIDSSGNLLVGTTATVNAAKSVFSFSSSNNGVYLVDSSGVSGAQFMRFDSTSNTCGQITRVGATSAVLYNTSSDYRLKENPTPLTGALERIAVLKPVQWVWKDCDGAVGEGFIAHEVQEVIPAAVTGEKDAVNEDGSIKPQGMDSSYLVATLTAAIQEQQAIIEQLRADVETLKGNA